MQRLSHWSTREVPCLVISDYFCFPTLQPEEVQRDQEQATGLAVVQPVPGAHPVPVYAFSIQDPSRREVRCSPALASPSQAPDPTCGKRWNGSENPDLNRRLLCALPALGGRVRSPSKQEPLPGQSEASRDGWSAVTSRASCLLTREGLCVERCDLRGRSQRGQQEQRAWGGEQSPATQVWVSAHCPGALEAPDPAL